MKVRLEKDGKVREYKAGVAMYQIWTIIFPPVSLILSIVFKQFKGTYLNILIISFIVSMVATVIGQANASLYALLGLVGYIAITYLAIMYTLNANKYSVRARMEEGYRVTNMDDPQVAAFVQSVGTARKPFLQILGF